MYTPWDGVEKPLKVSTRSADFYGCKFRPDYEENVTVSEKFVSHKGGLHWLKSAIGMTIPPPYFNGWGKAPAGKPLI